MTVQNYYISRTYEMFTQTLTYENDVQNICPWQNKTLFFFQDMKQFKDTI